MFAAKISSLGSPATGIYAALFWLSTISISESEAIRHFPANFSFQRANRRCTAEYVVPIRIAAWAETARSAAGQRAGGLPASSNWHGRLEAGRAGNDPLELDRVDSLVLVVQAVQSRVEGSNSA